MGFYLGVGTYQQRILIPYRAYEILMQDINDFGNVPEKEQISSFLNRMIKKFLS